MSEDPFVMAYFGLSSIVYPMPDRDTVVEVAQRYTVDYLIMPSGRPALDALISGEAEDGRFAFVADIPGTHLQFWRVVSVEQVEDGS